MARLLIRVSILALALMLPLTLAACGTPEEDEVPEPVPLEEDAADVDTTTDVDEPDADVEPRSDDVSGLEGDVEGIEGFLGRSGFPEDVPVPAGVLESSSDEDRGDERRYVLTIVNPAPIDSEAATDWYVDALEDAGFDVTRVVFERDSVGPSQRFMTIDAEIRAESADGLEVRIYIRPEDGTLAFGLEVREP